MSYCDIEMKSRSSDNFYLDIGLDSTDFTQFCKFLINQSYFIISRK